AVANYPTIMAGALAAADRVFEVLELPPSEGDRPGELPARFEREIEYRGVSFSYDGQAPVLRELDLTVQRGQIVAVVGPSGAGKTTLVDLLPRFYEPTSGWWGGGAGPGPAEAPSAPRSRGRCPATRRFSSSTRRRAPSTRNPSAWCRRRSIGSWRAVPCW